jgi:hypothetical protein
VYRMEIRHASSQDRLRNNYAPECQLAQILNAHSHMRLNDVCRSDSELAPACAYLESQRQGEEAELQNTTDLTNHLGTNGT